MTSDERRREAAESLRASANVGGARTLKRELARALGIRLGDCTPEGAHSKILRGLADLIDRSTCEMKGDPWAKYGRCSHCGAFVRRDAVTNCIGVIPVRYCPNCGARMVSGDGD